jgi:hypothetical protein
MLFLPIEAVNNTEKSKAEPKSQTSRKTLKLFYHEENVIYCCTDKP